MGCAARNDARHLIIESTCFPSLPSLFLPFLPPESSPPTFSPSYPERFPLCPLCLTTSPTFATRLTETKKKPAEAGFLLSVTRLLLRGIHRDLRLASVGRGGAGGRGNRRRGSGGRGGSRSSGGGRSSVSGLGSVGSASGGRGGRGFSGLRCLDLRSGGGSRGRSGGFGLAASGQANGEKGGEEKLRVHDSSFLELVFGFGRF